MIPPDDAPADAPDDAPDDAAVLGTHGIRKAPTRCPTQPIVRPAAAHENSEAADEVECDREPDIFDNEEEYVGLDDEATYAENPQPPEFAHPQPSDNANSNATDDPDIDFVYVEAEVDDADPNEVTVLHDPENPKIVKGGCFLISLHLGKP